LRFFKFESLRCKTPQLYTQNNNILLLLKTRPNALGLCLAV
jgi:hypothetical protein